MNHTHVIKSSNTNRILELHEIDLDYRVISTSSNARRALGKP